MSFKPSRIDDNLNKYSFELILGGNAWKLLVNLIKGHLAHFSVSTTLLCVSDSSYLCLIATFNRIEFRFVKALVICSNGHYLSFIVSYPSALHYVLAMHIRLFLTA